jgi:hypothetical protein
MEYVMWPYNTPASYLQVAALREDLHNLGHEVLTQLSNLGGKMADVSQMLNDLAFDLDELGTPLDELLAERDALAAEVAELRGEDVRESEAATAVRDSFNRVAARFQSEPSVPDVTPIEEQPATGGTDVINETPPVDDGTNPQ